MYNAVSTLFIKKYIFPLLQTTNSRTRLSRKLQNTCTKIGNTIFNNVHTRCGNSTREHCALSLLGFCNRDNFGETSTKARKRPASTNNNERRIINIIILDIQLSRKIDKTSSNGGIDVRRI